MEVVDGVAICRSWHFFGRKLPASTKFTDFRSTKLNVPSSHCSVLARASASNFKKAELSNRKATFRGRRLGDQWGEIVEEDSMKDRERPRDKNTSDPKPESMQAVKETPGKRFLNRALPMQSAKTAQMESNAEHQTGVKFPSKVKKKEQIPQVIALNHNEPSCYGCGALLQTVEIEVPGYVPPQTYELKKKHHQLKAVLCGRCQLLSQGQMIPAVSGVGGYGSGKGYIPAEKLRAQLSHLRQHKALVVKLVDIVDFNGSFLTRVRDLVGSNPIILVLTKVDLLPDGTDLAAVGDWLQEAVRRKKLNVISIHLTSAKAQTGISRVAVDISRQRLGRDVYILGSANVGKSAFVTALLRDMSRRDPFATASLRLKPVQSAMPGTTLGPIQFQAFAGGGKLYDTPGVHLHHRMAASLDPEDVCLLASRRRLRGYVMGQQGPEDDEPEEESIFEDLDLDAILKVKADGKGWSAEEEQTNDQSGGSWKAGSLVGCSLFWGGIARIDVVKAPEDLQLTFYGPSAIRVLKVPTAEADHFYKENLGKKLRPPSSSTVAGWMGLEKVQAISLPSERLTKHPAGDISISGFGWITVEIAETVEVISDSRGNQLLRADDSDPLEVVARDDGIKFVVHVPKAVEVFVRPSLPLGKRATKWYKYSDLSDTELEARPQIFY